MRIRLKSRRIVLADRLFDGFIYVANGTITDVTEQDLPFDKEYDFGEQYLAPGFIDLHVHGGAGYDFGSCTAEEAAEAASYHLAHGTTTMLPTLAAAPMADMIRALERLKPWIKNVCAEDSAVGPHIPGVHFEGPYFSPNQCGAQNSAFLSEPRPEEYLEVLKKYRDLIKRWSYAPERDLQGSFCKALTEYEILASAGHTDAVYEDMQTAFTNGCRLVTHLYSCTSTITRKQGYRQLGVIESAYLNPDMYVELIADGAHLPPELIRMIVHIKGREHVALVTDALSAAGAGAERGELNGVPYIVEDGVCKLPDRSAFAGSIATTDRLVRTCVQKVGLSVVDSVYMASSVPGELLREKRGRIEAGYSADLVVLDEELQVQKVFVLGEEMI